MQFQYIVLLEVLSNVYSARSECHGRKNNLTYAYVFNIRRKGEIRVILSFELELIVQTHFSHLHMYYVYLCAYIVCMGNVRINRETYIHMHTYLLNKKEGRNELFFYSFLELLSYSMRSEIKSVHFESSSSHYVVILQIIHLVREIETKRILMHTKFNSKEQNSKKVRMCQNTLFSLELGNSFFFILMI